MKIQTAIDILLDKLESLGFIESIDKEDLLYESVVEECKKIENKQIIDAYRDGFLSDDIKLSSEYYNNKFN